MFAEIKTHGASGTITLNDAERGNCLNAMGLLQFQQALEDLRQEKSIRGIIITGSGNYFSTGTDLLALSQQMESDPLDRNNSDLEILVEVLLAMIRYPKPIVSALNGPALGNGAALALAADIVIGCNATSIGFPEVARGLVASFGAVMLRMRLGRSTIAPMLLTGESLNAKQSCELGLVQEVVDSDLTWARSHEIIEAMNDTSPQSAQLTRKVLYETLSNSIEADLRSACGTAATARFTLSAREGVSAFVENRKPDWDDAYSSE